GTLRELYFPQRFYLQEGSYSVAFLDDETLLLTSSYTASGFVPLLQVDLVSEAFMTREDVVARTMLERSLDNRVITAAEPKDAFGPFATFDTATQERTAGSAKVMLHDAPINADASLIAFPTEGSVKIVGGAAQGYADVASITESQRVAVAAVFSPTSDSIFGTWSEGQAANTPPFVARYNITTQQSEGMLQKNILLATKREGLFEPTRMEITPDGTLLFVTVETGINV